MKKCGEGVVACSNAASAVASHEIQYGLDCLVCQYPHIRFAAHGCIAIAVANQISSLMRIAEFSKGRASGGTMPPDLELSAGVLPSQVGREPVFVILSRKGAGQQRIRQDFARVELSS